MKSDVVKVTDAGDGTEAALRAASDSARYRGLNKRDSLRLRLLAEEMLGMVRLITGEAEAEFWAESEGNAFELHLTARPLVTGKMRRELLKTASSGKNEAAKGFMGKMRDLFDRALSAEDTGDRFDYYRRGLVIPADPYLTDPVLYATSVNIWSMTQYKAAVEQEKTAAAKEEWDELERSIVANVADEVKVAIAGDRVEMTVYKTFNS